ncbi:omptin family outer membrane protease [Treponema sp. TIM-1]|uniref:omptin family outer membrane protease n=1 Tax=Treponema sp. TIM-1 TaxID=2898417 RepID=UPI003980F295
MRKIFLCGLFVVMTLALSAQEIATKWNDHNLFLGASLGLLSGKSDEIVYRNASTKNKLSQLLWDIKPLVYAGIDINYHWQKPENTWSIFANTSFKFGFPGKTGVLEDRDWMASEYPQFLTHYSMHDNKTENAVFIDASAGASFQIFGQFLLKPSISYNVMHFYWEANGGSLLYPDSYGGHGYLRPIDVITYKQTWHIISPGVAFYGEFNRYFNAEIAFKISPLIWCIGEDDHILRDLTITTDNLAIGLFIEPSLLFSFIPNIPKDFFTLSLSVLYRNISYVRGDGIYKELGKPARTVKNIMGAGYSAFDVGLTARFKLRWPVRQR